MAPLRFETVATADALAAAGPVRMQLWATCDALLFQSHAWVSA